jgi:hypothetical protein
LGKSKSRLENRIALGVDCAGVGWIFELGDFFWARA